MTFQANAEARSEAQALIAQIQRRSAPTASNAGSSTPPIPAQPPSSGSGQGQPGPTPGSGNGGNGNQPPNTPTPSGGGGIDDWCIRNLGMSFKVVLGAVSGLLALFAGAYGVMYDTPPNKTEIEKKYYDWKREQEETKQAALHPVSNNPVVSSASSSVKQPSLLSGCSHTNGWKAGSFVLAEGVCMVIPTTKYPVTVATESAVLSIDGADFQISDEQSEVCESATTVDRCASWIQEHQKIGRPDSRFNIPRYWFTYVVQHGEITINTAR